MKGTYVALEGAVIYLVIYLSLLKFSLDIDRSFIMALICMHDFLVS